MPDLLRLLAAFSQFTSQTRLVSESMVAGTVAGELTFISRTPRNATVTAELATTVWMLDQDGLARLEEENPREAIHFVKVLMKVSKEEHDGACPTRDLPPLFVSTLTLTPAPASPPSHSLAVLTSNLVTVLS